MKRTRVNVLSVINSASNITTETIDGTEHIVVKNICPLYDNCVLNGGLYPTEENNKGYLSLNEVPMPYGHPKIDGKYVSARDVRALNNHWIGAYSINPRKDGEKTLVDMRVNRRIAEGTDHGKKVLGRLDAMMKGESTEPISISTGLNLNKIQANGRAPNGKTYTWIATNQQYDHIAILLDEEPAGSPSEGIGMFVNSEDGSEIEIEAVNLADADTPDPEQPMLKEFFTKFTAWFSANHKTQTNEEETDPMKSLIINALKAKGKPTEGKTDAELMDAYNQMVSEDAKKEETPEEKAKREKEEADKKAKETATNSDMQAAITAAVNAAIEPLKAQLTANSDKEKAGMREAVKAKFGMTETAVNALDGEPLKELFAQCQTSLGLNGRFQSTTTESISNMPE